MVASPTVSVLVPVYNVQAYLAECLDSLATQTFTDAEFICINDGSTDSSREIIQEYLDKDSRFTVIDKLNSGYGASMNQGLDAARGKYIAILESDDIMAPTALANLHAAISAENADLAKANCWLYWSKSQRRSELFDLIPPDLAGKTIEPKYHPEMFYAKPSIWSAMYKTEFLRRNNIRFLETPGASFQDLSFTFKVYAKAQRATLLDTPVVHYRQDNENSSVNSPGKVNAIFTEYAEISRWLSEHPDKHLESVKVKMLFDTTNWNYERVAPEHKLTVIEKAATILLEQQKLGHIDLRILTPREILAIRTMMQSPQRYHEQYQHSKRLHVRLWRLWRTNEPREFVNALIRKVRKELRKRA